MIKTKTLFILGAGASKPYGYPTNIKLRKLIRDRTNNQYMINALKILKGVAYDREDWSKQVDVFVDEFSKSSVYSIDLFLENRPDFMEIGKMQIAASLLPNEDDTKLRESEDNWYMYLYDRMKSSFEDFDKNKISFITFNYDRSLEQFLFNALKSTFSKPDKVCAEKLSKIPIVHLYGQLDLLPWQSKDGFHYLPAHKIVKRIINARENLKLISEERDVEESKAFKDAYELIEKAEIIYFLGFGFDEINLKRLNIELMKRKSVRGTSLGLELSRKSWVYKYFKAKERGNIELQDCDVLSLLKNVLKYE